jgi:hypothetical protein
MGGAEIGRSGMPEPKKKSRRNGKMELAFVSKRHEYWK